MNRPDLAIVVALTDSPPRHLGEGLARFAEEAGPRGEVLLVDASEVDRRFTRVRVLRRPRGRLAPTLWRDGLLATDAPLVALTTAQMVPRRGWIEALRLRLEATGAAGVGGPIEPGPDLSAVDRAVALLRYANYFPPCGPAQPPGDNALYRRDRLMEVEPSWLDGFWEVDVHQALLARGFPLAMADDDRATVAFLGGIGLASMIRQRFRHGRRYGLGRSSGLGIVARSVRMAASPLVPPWLCGRALRARRMAMAWWLPALIPLLGLASAWALGEAVGTCPDLRNRGRRPMTRRTQEVA